MVGDIGVLLQLVDVYDEIDETELVESFDYVAESLGGKLTLAPVCVFLVLSFGIVFHFRVLFVF